MLNSVGTIYFDAPFRGVGRRFRPRHLHADVLERNFPPDLFDYAFMTVRNPVRRLISEYRYQCRKPGLHWQKLLGFDQWFAVSSARARFHADYRENHFRLQTEFRCFGCEVFRIEDGLDRVASRIAEIASLPDAPDVERLNTAPGHRVRVSLRSFQRILDVYSDDFEAFGYSADPSDYSDVLA